MGLSANDSLIFSSNSTTCDNVTGVMLCSDSPEYDNINVMPTIVFLSCVAVVGLVGNGLVCVVQFKFSLKTSFGQLVLHLAIYDFLSCAVVIPVALFALTDESDSVSEKAVYYLGVIGVTCSLVTMLLIAIDRYRKVCKPLQPGISLRLARYFFFLESGFGIFYALPLMFATDIVISARLVEEYCCIFYDSSYDGSLHFTYIVLLTALLGAVFVVLVWCYWNVAIAIKRRRQRGTARNVNNSDSRSVRGSSVERYTNTVASFGLFSPCRSGSTNLVSPGDLAPPRRRSVKTAKIVFIVGITIVVCCIPSLGIMFYRMNENFKDIFKQFPDDEDGRIDGGIVLLCQVWYTTTHAVNPIIYAFMENAFRKEIRTILGRCKQTICNVWC